jgi:hypothetical protein
MKRFAFVALGVLVLGAASSARAASLVFIGALNGAQESPSVTTTGTGFVTVTVDPVASTMRIDTTWNSLTAGTTVAHIHCCFVPGGPANVIPATMTPSLAGFPEGVTSGTYDMTFDLNDAATYNADFLAANAGSVDLAKNELIGGLSRNDAYFNIHTTANPNGEISDFLVRIPPGTIVPVPEPPLLALLGFTLAGIAMRRRTA